MRHSATDEPVIFWDGSRDWSELSNCYVDDFTLALPCGEFRFSSAEVAYHCLKQQKLTKSTIAPFQMACPVAARHYGRIVPTRPDWEAVKEDVMMTVLRAKFGKPAMRDVLLQTGGRHLIYWSRHDDYWGVGAGGFGRNRLGVLLMRLRSELSNVPMSKVRQPLLLGT